MKNNTTLNDILLLSNKNLSKYNSDELKKFIHSIDVLIENINPEYAIKLTMIKLLILKTMNENDKILKISLNTLPKLDNNHQNEKIRLRQYIATQYKMKYQYDKAIKYLSEAKELSYKIGNNDLYFETTINLANLYLEMKDYNKSEAIYNDLLKFVNNKNMKEETADIYTNLGLLEMNKKDYKKSIYYFKKADSLYDKNKNAKKVYILYANLSNLYLTFANFDKAITYALKAVEIGEKYKNWDKLSKIYNNLGLIYMYLKKYESATAYYTKSIELKKKINDKIGLAKTLNNLSEIMYVQKHYKKALSYLEESLKLKSKTGDDYSIFNTLYNMIKCYLEINNLQKVLKLIHKMENLKPESSDKMSIYEMYYIYYQKKKEYKTALEYQKKYFELFLKMDKEKQNHKIQTLLEKFENEKAEKEKRYFHLKNIELKKANATKDKFFSIIAHDLKSPFSSITAFITLMKMGYDKFSPEKIQKMIDELDKNVKNTYSLLENLLTWSRLQARSIKFQPREIKLYLVAYRILEIYKLKAKEKKIEIINNTHEETIVTADSYMLDTVIRNLINNAIKFTPEGGKITISDKILPDNKVRISVTDTGVGIPKNKINKLFKIESSFSTYGTNNEKGTGLGLILCKDFVEKNHGTITVSSEEGKGTSFIITLPGKNK